ncbi:MAG: tetratricopeptide repeat protein [Chlorobi bacterium]|nr:tetratricopeptide repeat protein [Chlorobiota bacterium]MBX7217956.1 LuxR C-terminal-related transcriptional regulator [Candidatus Kapabacteria bacterium]
MPETFAHFATSATLALLRTKLYVPRPQPNLVERERLFALVDQGLQSRLTLISAPPGFGKTTLVSEWAWRTERMVGWVSLDEGDNDLRRFLRYVAAALHRLDQRVGKTALGLLQSPQGTPEGVLTSLLNDVLEANTQMLLVLDDYHTIDSPEVHDALLFMLDHLPDECHIILTSRVDPPLPLARLRGRRQLTEIRSGDLRFTPDEAAAFLNAVMGLDLAANDVAALESRTEGWIAGLQLAALSVRNRSDASGFIQAFTGSHRHVVDYLADEVLHRQPEAVQRFLVETSILDRLTGHLCDAVTGTEGGAARLQTLEEVNLFIMPLDEARYWYRYHHLFADFLRSRLAAGSPEIIPELHHRAALWYQEQGLLTEAIRHFLAADDATAASKIVLRYAEEKLVRSELSLLLSWFRMLPESAIEQNAGLSVIYAWVLIFTGQISKAPKRIEDGERALAMLPPQEHRQEHRMYAGHIIALHAFMARINGGAEQGIALSLQALAMLPIEQLGARGAVKLNLALAYLLQRNVERARAACLEALPLSISARHLYAALASIRLLERLEVIHGKLQQAMEWCHQGLELARHEASEETTNLSTAVVHLSIGELEYEWNNIEKARTHLSEGIRLAELSGEILTQRDGYVAVARLQHTTGDDEGALQTLATADDLAHRYSVPDWIRSPLATFRTRLHLERGEIEAAAAWMQEKRPRLDRQPNDGWQLSGWIDYNEVERRTVARVLIATGEYAEALTILTELAQLAETEGRDGNLIVLLNLMAIAHCQCGNEPEALPLLERALRLGQPERYTRTFVDEGEAMRGLLLRLRKKIVGREGEGGMVDYLDRLLGAFPQRQPSGTPAQGKVRAAAIATQFLLDPLSQREIEVLQLVARGNSNREIAERLFVAPGTVKRHIHNIHEKLGVDTRTRAIAKAREMGVIE